MKTETEEFLNLCIASKYATEEAREENRIKWIQQHEDFTNF